MKLLLDQGNTNLRWATLSPDGSMSPGGVLPPGVPLDEAMLPVRQIIVVPVSAVFVSSVAGESRDQEISAAVFRSFQVRAVFLRSLPQVAGLVNGYREPGKLGVDRWLDMLGARALCNGHMLVVDAGSAMTVDAVTAGGLHVGGLIVPGYRMQCASLQAGTARVGPPDAGDFEGWGTDTPAAVSNGVLNGLAGLIERSVREFERGVAERCSLVLTGGDARRIANRLQVGCLIDDDLLFRGMIAQLAVTGENGLT